MIIEKAINSSYIDNLFVSMFYKQSHIQNLLCENINDVKFLHLQDLIYKYFVLNMRFNYVVSSELINEIRNYMVYCGWKNNENFMSLFEIHELYDFILSKNKKLFEYENKKNEKMYLNYINLDVDNDTNIKSLLENYDLKNEDYELKEIPNFIAIRINRLNKNNNTVNIMKGIKFSKINNKYWIIHSIICFSKSENNYYSIIVFGNNWYMFNNLKSINLIEINIKNTETALKIQRELVFLFYTSDKDNKIM